MPSSAEPIGRAFDESSGWQNLNSKMVANTQSDEPTKRDRLNRIADQQSADNQPEDAPRGEVIDLCEALHDELEDLITTHVTETALTQREAEVWVLTNCYGANQSLLTDEAIALALATPESPFGTNNESDPGSDKGGSLTAADVRECYTQAEDKYSEAEEFVGLTTFRNRGEVLDQPKMMWVDQATARRIESRCKPADDTLDDTLTRLLDDTATHRSLAELIRRYLASRGKEDVAQVAINRSSFGTGTLSLTAHTAAQGEVPNVIKETDAIVIDGQQYDFYLDEDPDGPHEGLGRVSLYAADNLTRVDAVTVEDGVEAARERLENAPDVSEGEQL